MTIKQLDELLDLPGVTGEIKIALTNARIDAKREELRAQRIRELDSAGKGAWPGQDDGWRR